MIVVLSNAEHCFFSSQWRWIQMEGACLQTPNRTSVSTAMQRSGAPIIYADMCLYTQVSMCVHLHESVHMLVEIGLCTQCHHNTIFSKD